MDEKVILITGGSRGLGEECVKSLSASGDNIIFFTYSNASSDARPVGNVIPVLCNQKNESEVVACVDGIIAEKGKLDVLVNNACPGFRPCDLMDTDWGMFQELLDVNVKGAYMFTREAARHMKMTGSGRIINILSSYIIGVPPDKLSFYLTAKYALFGLSKASATELCKHGITVNMISPGMMKTQLTDYLPDRYFQAYQQKHPMKRMAKTSDVAGVLSFLVSDAASFLNGVNIPVNGGEAF